MSGAKVGSSPRSTSSRFSMIWSGVSRWRIWADRVRMSEIERGVTVSVDVCWFCWWVKRDVLWPYYDQPALEWKEPHKLIMLVIFESFNAPKLGLYNQNYSVVVTVFQVMKNALESWCNSWLPMVGEKQLKEFFGWQHPDALDRAHVATSAG